MLFVEVLIIGRVGRGRAGTKVIISIAVVELRELLHRVHEFFTFARENREIVLVFRDVIDAEAENELRDRVGERKAAVNRVSVGVQRERVVAVEVSRRFAVLGQLVERPFSVADDLVWVVKLEIVHHRLVEEEAPEAVPAHQMCRRCGEVVLIFQ